MTPATEIRNEIARLEARAREWTLRGADGDTLNSLDIEIEELNERLFEVEHPEDFA